MKKRMHLPKSSFKNHLAFLCMVLFCIGQPSYGQEFYMAAKRLFVPGGGRTGQEACDNLAKIYAGSIPGGTLTYMYATPFDPSQPYNPEHGNCRTIYGGPFYDPYDGGRCEKNWSAVSQYGIGGAVPSNPKLAISDSNPGYVYASPDLLCKRSGVDLAKNAGTPACHLCTGFPIHFATGNKYLREQDYVGAHNLHFERHYNYFGDVLAADAGALANNGVTNLGSRWRGTYLRVLSISETSIASISTVRAIRDDGNTLYFTKVKGQSGWNGEADRPDRLVESIDTNNNRTGWIFYDAKTEETESYSATGKLLSITSRNGYQIGLTYSDGTNGAASGQGGFILDANGNPTATALPAGLLLRVQDVYGRRLRFDYDASSRIVRLMDPSNSVILYGYDAATNNLVKVTYPNNQMRQYLYNEPANTSGANLPNALTGIIDENGIRLATYRYDASGRAVEEVYPSAGTNVNHYTLRFDSSGLQTIVTDPLGAARTYTFENKLGVMKLDSLVQPGGAGSSAASSLMTYDANGNVASRTDFNGTVTTYSYDLSRNLETRRVEASGTASARTISTDWHSTYRLPTRIAEPNKLTINSYDTHGNLLSRSEQATSDATGSQGFDAPLIGSARVWHYSYNDVGQVPTATDPNGNTTTYAYDGSGNLVSITNAAGQVTTLSAYDANGRVGRITDANGQITTLGYAPRGWLTTRQVGDELTRYDYDGVGQLTAVTLPDGSAIHYTYDDAHRLTDIADSAGDHIHYTLDAIGNRIQEQTTDPNGTLIRQTTRVYDALNRLQQITGGVQ